MTFPVKRLNEMACSAKLVYDKEYDRNKESCLFIPIAQLHPGGQKYGLLAQHIEKILPNQHFVF